MTVYHTEIMEYEGHRFEVRRLYEPRSNTMPWLDEDGHGVIAGWTIREPHEGEEVLMRDRGLAIYYDMPLSAAKALEEGWGWLPEEMVLERDDEGKAPYEKRGGAASCKGVRYHDPEDFNRAIGRLYQHFRDAMSPQDYALEAARRDFERLKAWCNDEWHYTVIEVELLETNRYGKEVPTGVIEALGGYESDMEAKEWRWAAEEIADQVLAKAEEMSGTP